MAQWIVFSVVALLTSNAVADILVQPGYGQPRSIEQSHSLIHPMAHPLPTMQHVTEKEVAQLQQASPDPGYHYELHPVYPGLHQAPGDTMIPYSLAQAHQLTPYLTRAAQRRLNSGKFGDFGLGLPMGMPAAIPPQYHYPLAVHNRYRRSIGDESTSGAEMDKRDETDMAAKSSLTEKVSPAVDLQSRGGEATKDLDDKHVGVRQSGNGERNAEGILFGLNPSNMKSVYEYRSVKTPPSNPAFNSYQQIMSEQGRAPTLSQINSRAATQQQTPSQNQVATSAQIASIRANPENMQHAVPVQPLPLQHQQSGILGISVDKELRNFPDPRPVSSAPQSLRTGTSDGHSKSQTSANTRHAETGNDKELVGEKLRSQNELINQQGRTFEAPRYAPTGSYGSSCTNPGDVVHNEVPSNDLAIADVNPQPVLQVYQVPSAQNAIYSPNVNYVVAPQMYTSNYPTGYSLSYPSSASTVRYCLQNLNSPPSVMYQLI